MQTSAGQSEDLISLQNEALMGLLQSAEDPETVNRLFDELFRRFHPRVVAWCTRITNDSDRGRDLAQEVFWKAFRYRHSYRGDSRVSTWLYAIARNHCVNALRTRESDPLGRSDSLHAGLVDTSHNIHGNTEQAQRFARLCRLIERTLTGLETRVIVLHYGHELTLATITAQLMLSNPSGAKAYIVNARRKLKRVLAEAECDAWREQAA